MTIAREFEPADREENLGAPIERQTAERTGEHVVTDAVLTGLPDVKREPAAAHDEAA